MGLRKFLPVVILSVLSLAFLPLLVDNSFGGVVIPPNPIPNPILGDFKCYTAEDVFFTVPNPLSLDDQFGIEEPVNVIDFIKLCLQVEKDASDFWLQSPTPQIPDQHFSVYLFEEVGGTVAPLQTVELADQFGKSIHIVGEPIELWVPSSKQGTGSNLCPVGYTFNAQSIQCEGPQNPCPPPGFPNYGLDNGICAGPSIQAGSFPNLNTQNIHYKCYEINPVTNPILSTPVVLSDQFFTLKQNSLMDANKLCVPVIKTELGCTGLFATYNPTTGLCEGIGSPIPPTPIAGPFGSKTIPDHLKCYPINNGLGLVGTLSIADQLSSVLPIISFNENEFCTLTTKEIIQISVGGEMMPVDSTALLVAGAQMNAAWMIPVIVSAIGIGIVIARKF